MADPGILGATQDAQDKRIWFQQISDRLSSLKDKFSKRPERKTDTRSLDSWPETYGTNLSIIGYPKLALFQTSQPNFSLYRGFSYLYGRILLELQREIALLEQELDDFDVEDSDPASNHRQVNPHSIERDILTNASNVGSATAQHATPDPPQQSTSGIIPQSAQGTMEPNTTQSSSKTRREVIERLKPVLKTTPIVESEATFLEKKEDITTLHQGREWAAFDESLLKAALKIPLLRNSLRTDELRAKTTDPYVQLYHWPRVETAANYLISPILCILLVIPKCTGSISLGNHQL